jgi:hypothetical protein
MALIGTLVDPPAAAAAAPAPAPAPAAAGPQIGVSCRTLSITTHFPWQQAPEYSFYWGSPVRDGTADAALQLEKTSPSTNQEGATAADTSDTTLSQNLLVALNAVEDPWALLDFAAANHHQMQLRHWLRLLFR